MQVNNTCFQVWKLSSHLRNCLWFPKKLDIEHPKTVTSLFFIILFSAE